LQQAGQAAVDIARTIFDGVKPDKDAHETV
jgi:hypothetical protein